MWIFLADPPCFISVVQKPGDAHLTVRARVRSDLEAFASICDISPITSTPHADYQFRAMATHDAFATALAFAATRIRYSNFKGAILARVGREREAVYEKVWAVLYDGFARRTRPQRS